MHCYNNNYYYYLYPVLPGSIPEPGHSTPENFEEKLITSTPLHKELSPGKPKARRMLPTLHGGTERNGRKLSDSDDVIAHVQELRGQRKNSDHDMKRKNSIDRADDEDLVYSEAGHVSVNMKAECNTDGPEHDESLLYAETGYRRETLPSTEDQMSATESEADRILSSSNEEEMREDSAIQPDAQETKQQLHDILNDLARPYSQKTAGEESRPSDGAVSKCFIFKWEMFIRELKN